MLATLEALLSQLLHGLLSTLETLFASKTSRRFGGFRYSNDDNDGFHDGSRLHQLELQKAYELFETSSQEATRESIKRKWRKLSLQHHPDRNDNSPESVAMSQKLNHAYDLLNEEFDRMEGKSDDSDSLDGNVNKSDSGDENAGPYQDSRDYHFNAKQEKPFEKKERRKQARRQRQEEKRQQEQAEKAYHDYKRQKTKVKVEQDRIKRQQKELRQQGSVNKKRSRKKRKNHLINRKQESAATTNTDIEMMDIKTQVGRDRAHELWEETAKRSMDDTATFASEKTPRSPPKRGESSMHDIDDDDDYSTPPSTPTAAPPETPKPKRSSFSTESTPNKAKHGVKTKPPHLVMDSCTNEIAIAIRLGLEDVAIVEIAEAVYCHDDILCDMTPVEFMQLPLDSDGNTILHYAVYYEAPQVLSCVVQLLSSESGSYLVFLQKNNQGQVPADFGKCCIKDTNLRDRIEHLTDIARQELEDTKLYPTCIKPLKRLWGIICHINFCRALNTILWFALVGKRVFGCGNLASLIMCVITSFCEKDEFSFGNQGAQLIFVHHFIWSIMRFIFCMIRMVTSWELALLVVPVFLLFGCCSSGTGARVMLTGPLWIIKVFTIMCSVLFAALLLTMNYVSDRIMLNRITSKLSRSNDEVKDCLTVTLYSLVGIFYQYALRHFSGEGEEASVET